MKERNRGKMRKSKRRGIGFGDHRAMCVRALPESEATAVPIRAINYNENNEYHMH